MTSGSKTDSIPTRSGRHRVFAEAVRFVLAPLVLLISGFYTANFIVSGRYAWPQTSRVLVLTLTVLVLSYEFVYKEQLSQNVPSDRAKATLLYSCLLPYVIGWVVLLVLWKL